MMRNVLIALLVALSLTFCFQTAASAQCFGRCPVVRVVAAPAVLAVRVAAVPVRFVAVPVRVGLMPLRLTRRVVMNVRARHQMRVARRFARRSLRWSRC